jgi:hypothetical protein
LKEIEILALKNNYRRADVNRFVFGKTDDGKPKGDLWRNGTSVKRKRVEKAAGFLKTTIEHLLKNNEKPLPQKPPAAIPPNYQQTKSSDGIPHPIMDSDSGSFGIPFIEHHVSDCFGYSYKIENKPPHDWLEEILNDGDDLDVASIRYNLQSFLSSTRKTKALNKAQDDKQFWQQQAMLEKEKQKQEEVERTKNIEKAVKEQVDRQVKERMDEYFRHHYTNEERQVAAQKE